MTSITRVNMLFFNTTSPINTRNRTHTFAANTALALGSLLLCLLAIEAGYRLIDPFPYISQNESNHSEYGNLSGYDQLLGWKGVPSAQAEFITNNSRTWLKNNSLGFRDIEHAAADRAKPAIVFLGDSFTWGYEVNFEEMFVNRLRNMLPEFDIHNLSHRGYGTDQSLLTFAGWNHPGPIRHVVLMMSENDVDDNNSDYGSGKPKPIFQLIDGQLVLRGVPVPMLDSWATPPPPEKFVESWKSRGIEFFLRSHLVHDMAYRLFLHRQGRETREPFPPLPAGNDLTLTRHLLGELKKEATARKAELTIFLIPSKREIEKLDGAPPYQTAIADICANLGIRCHDLATDFKKEWLRTYYRHGMHWNPRGNRVASQAIYSRLTGR
ncbi:MAG: hypothetical protein A2X85_02655 [Geobacteraceae bacterium GWF2_54_21]|nr:MAG: hypothetical protein A2X85_02655 [Geobacteraceae bacterium GWF2_54_21]